MILVKPLMFCEMASDLCMTDGDMGHKADAVSAYMKQKHRLIWERRHGPVGSGRKTVLQPPEN